EVIIPLVVGTSNTTEKVFPTRTKGVSRLPRVEPRNLKATRVAPGGAFDTFVFPASERCFKHDVIAAANDDPLRLYAAAGEHESCQLLLVPKSSESQTYSVEATELAGPDGSRVRCESVNEFIYVPTQIPSGYNARK